MFLELILQSCNLLFRSKAESCLGIQCALILWKCKCSWMMIFIIPTDRCVYSASWRQIICQLSRIRRSTHWMFTGMTAVGSEPSRSESSFITIFFKTFAPFKCFIAAKSFITVLLEVFCEYHMRFYAFFHKKFHYNMLFHVWTTSSCLISDLRDPRIIVARR